MNYNTPGIERLCWIAFLGIALGWFLAGLPQGASWLEPRNVIGLVAGGGIGIFVGSFLIRGKATPQPVPVDERKDVNPH